MNLLSAAYLNNKALFIIFPAPFVNRQHKVDWNILNARHRRQLYICQQNSMQSRKYFRLNAKKSKKAGCVLYEKISTDYLAKLNNRIQRLRKQALQRMYPIKKIYSIMTLA